MSHPAHPDESCGLFPFGMTNLFGPRLSEIPSDLAKLFEGPMETNDGFMYRVPPIVPQGMHARVEDVEENGRDDKRDEGSQELE